MTLKNQIKPLLRTKLVALLEKRGGLVYTHTMPEFNLLLQIERVSQEGVETNTCFYFLHKEKIYKMTELL